MKRVLTLVLALSVLSASAVLAQDEKDDGAIVYSASFGLGTTLPFNPDEFDSNWDPSLGVALEVGAARGILEVAADFDYSFFLANGREPVDANALAMFLQLKIKPLDTTARPYVFVGGGYFRFWIVNQDLYENVLGFGGGAGVEIEIDDSRRIYVEGRTIQGRTRIDRVTPDLPSFRKANVELISMRAGVTFVF